VTVPYSPAYSGWMRQAEVRFRPQGRMAIDPRGFRQPRPGDLGGPMTDVEAINAHNRRLMERRMRPPAPNGQQPGTPRPYQKPASGPPRP